MPARSRLDLTGLLVDQLVVHPIPKREPKATADQQAALVSSEGLTPLTDILRVYINTRLRASLQSADRAFDVAFDDALDCGAPAQIRTFLRKESRQEGSVNSRSDLLLDISQKMAKRLFEIQPHGLDPSLLAVSAGSIEHTPFIGVMKLEHERGVTAEERNVGGRRTFEMSVEERLVLVSGTKVFKAAVFAPLSPDAVCSDPEDFQILGTLSDSQNPFTTAGPAAYFAVGLLGTRLETEPRVQTERVFKAVEKYINEGIEDPAEKVAAQRALLVEMSSNKGTFSAETFGTLHFTAATRRGLREHLEAEGLPTKGFPKNTDLIRSRLKLIALELEGRITVVAPEERFEDETIQVEQGDGTQGAIVTIRAGVKRTHSRGR